MQNAKAYITRSKQNGKTGGGSGEPTTQPYRRTRRSHSPDRQGLSNAPGRVSASWTSDRKLSVSWPYRLRKNSHCRGDCRVAAEGFSIRNQDRLRGVSTQP